MKESIIRSNSGLKFINHSTVDTTDGRLPFFVLLNWFRGLCLWPDVWASHVSPYLYTCHCDRLLCQRLGFKTWAGDTSQVGTSVGFWEGSFWPNSFTIKTSQACRKMMKSTENLKEQNSETAFPLTQTSWAPPPLQCLFLLFITWVFTPKSGFIWWLSKGNLFHRFQ